MDLVSLSRMSISIRVLDLSVSFICPFPEYLLVPSFLSVSYFSIHDHYFSVARKLLSVLPRP